MKDIPGYDGLYAATKDGKIWSHTTKKFLRSYVNDSNHLVVRLSKNGVKKTKMSHRLVLEAFVGPCPEGMECCHNDGNPANNKLENLRWDTRSANHQDAVKHGTHSGFRCGTLVGNSVLDETKVQWIRFLHRHKLFTIRELAELFNVFRTTIDNVVARRTWKHV